jgi:hypothetical protein
MSFFVRQPFLAHVLFHVTGTEEPIQLYLELKLIADLDKAWWAAMQARALGKTSTLTTAIC